MMGELLKNALYLFVLINPVSKVAVLAALPGSAENQQDLRSLAWRSSLVAAGILLLSMIGGNYLLQSIFRVDLHALQLAGGVVLFWVGFNALRNGVFFEVGRFEEVALVPLACPMIAGPATISACITLWAREDPKLAAAAAMLIAVGANHVIMLLSRPIARVLRRYDLLGAIVRLTGLIVMTIGAQMALEGITAWRNVRVP
jgi:multiple antibiotic resistance protein